MVAEEPPLLVTQIDRTIAVVASGTVNKVVGVAAVRSARYLLYAFAIYSPENQIIASSLFSDTVGV